MPKPLIILLSLLLNVPVFATHIFTAEFEVNFIEVDSNGNYLYEVNLYAYRDCENSEVPFDQYGMIGVYNRISKQRVAIHKSKLSKKDIIKGGCNLESCIEKGFYTMMIALPYNDSGYIFSYERCCRPTTSNLSLSGVEFPEQSIYKLYYLHKMVMNKSTSVANVYLESKGPTNVFPLQLIDTDGDSLTFEVVDPYATPNATMANAYPDPSENLKSVKAIEFASGYSSSEIFGQNSELEVLENTVRVVIPELGIYSFSVLVKEFRGGDLIAERNIDFLIQRSVSTPAEAISEFNAAYGTGRSTELFWQFCEPTISHEKLFRYTKGQNDTMEIANFSAPSAMYWDSSDLQANSIYGYQLRSYDSFDVNYRSTRWIEIGFGNLGVDNIEVRELLFYPNPVKDHVKINLDGVRKVIVHDLQGRDVLNYNIINRNSNLELDLSGLQKGPYVLEVFTEDGGRIRASQLLIKQ